MELAKIESFLEIILKVNQTLNRKLPLGNILQVRM